MTARTKPPIADAVFVAGAAPDAHWAEIDPVTGRILSVSGTGMGTLPPHLQVLLNFQPIPAEHAAEFHSDPIDRTWQHGKLGRCGALPLRLKTEARIKRAALLAGSDYLVVADYPIDAAKLAAWKVYRQALRDITKQPGYPKTIVWPTPPAS